MKLFCTLLFALFVGQASAGPIDDALAAWARGDYSAELKITRPLALKGEAWAQFFLGESHANGKGVAKNDAEAVKWYRLAAAQGYASAHFNVGYMYSNGEGVLQDYAKAVKWYRLAAAQGDASAQVNLGFMYSSGQGVLQDYTKAHAWYNLAATKGNANAVKNRDIIANLMTPQQIADAQKLARDCLARNFKGCD